MADIYEELGRILAAREDERQETCVGCGNDFYVNHLRDRLCPTCRQAGKPGWSVLQRRHRLWSNIFNLATGILSGLMVFWIQNYFFWWVLPFVWFFIVCGIMLLGIKLHLAVNEGQIALIALSVVFIRLIF